MKNFHCLSSNCARVVYREYLPPVVRWRYPDEEWQSIEGNDYAIEEKLDCSGIPWQFNYQRANSATKNGDECIANNWEQPKVRSYFNYSDETPFSNLRIQYERDIVKSVNQVDENTFLESDPIAPVYGTCRFGNVAIRIIVDTPVAKNRIIFNSQGFAIRVWNFKPNDADLERCTNKCAFTITRNGEIVHEETRNVCPEIEQLPCRLSDEYKEIKINKSPYLTHVLVIDAYFQNYIGLIPAEPLESNWGNGFVRSNPIPSECLNIYRLAVLTFVPTEPNSVRISNTNQAGYVLVKQICSGWECPAPEYEVFCNCNEECPPDTCPVRCGGSICCYNTTGKSVKEIPLSSLFPSNEEVRL